MRGNCVYNKDFYIPIKHLIAFYLIYKRDEELHGGDILILSVWEPLSISKKKSAVPYSLFHYES